LDFGHAPNCDAKLGWQRGWFYLPKMVLVLTPSSQERLGEEIPSSWWSYPIAAQLGDLSALLTLIGQLRILGLTGPVVMHTFFQCQDVLPLKERVKP
jgi:hypothetical protein